MITVYAAVDDGLRFFTETETPSGILKVCFNEKRSVKDLMESIGIPHVEIGSIRIDGESASDAFVISSDCRIDVLPPDVCILPEDVTDASGSPRFILDVHLGKLALNLRMLGFYADYENDRDDPELADASAGENGTPGGILLSCDRGLLMRSKVINGMVVRSRNPVEQAAEVLRRFNLKEDVKPLSRCSACNGLLEPAGGLSDLDSESAEQLPPGVQSWCSEFFKCPDCGKLFWKGRYYDKILEKVNTILEMV